MVSNSELEDCQFKHYSAFDQFLVPNFVIRLLLTIMSKLNDVNNKQRVNDAGLLTESQSSPRGRPTAH